MASKWQNLGALLGVSPSMIEEIRADNNRVRNCLQALLTEWLKHKDLKPSWDVLADSVQQLDNYTLANEIREQHLNN